MLALRPGSFEPVLSSSREVVTVQTACALAAPSSTHRRHRRHRRHDRRCSALARSGTHSASGSGGSEAAGMEQGLSGKCVETLEPVALNVSGQVPAWLSGELLRNGPGQFDVPLESGRGVRTVTHW